jgi:hypothetical protein
VACLLDDHDKDYVQFVTCPFFSNEKFLNNAPVVPHERISPVEARGFSLRALVD